MLAMVADEALQIHGGMGLMSDLPLERIWRDARIERIWDGTSEVQRHIISNSPPSRRMTLRSRLPKRLRGSGPCGSLPMPNSSVMSR
jgi:hypothetical protein